MHLPKIGFSISLSVSCQVYNDKINVLHLPAKLMDVKLSPDKFYELNVFCQKTGDLDTDPVSLG